MADEPILNPTPVKQPALLRVHTAQIVVVVDRHDASGAPVDSVEVAVSLSDPRLPQPQRDYLIEAVKRILRFNRSIA